MHARAAAEAELDAPQQPDRRYPSATLTQTGSSAVKGIIFNLLEEVVAQRYGEDVWDSLLAEADVDGSYTSLGSYPDDELFRLVGAASAALDLPADSVVRQFGESAIPLLASRYQSFFDGHLTTRSFLLTLNDIIHPEVKKLYPGADVPNFAFEQVTDDALVIRYWSARKLCALAEGFILGAATHYGEKATVEQPVCMHRGADYCLLASSFTPA